MAESVRFSPHPNRAREIGWRSWSPAAFDEASSVDRPVFLNVSTVWCHWCHRMDEVAFSDESIIRLLNEDFIPIRVDGDRYPHVQDRYIAGGWPTNAFLTPTGEVLWAATYTEPEQLRGAAQGVLGAWKERREEFQQEIERRRRALESSRNRQTALGLVRREAADDVMTATRDAFDPRNGGFGTAPKFPSPRATELLYLHSRLGDPGWAEMADRTLDGMLAGELFDRVDGGFFRYAMSDDWTAPRYEKLLDVNAAMLAAYAHGAHLRGRREWRAAAERTVEWADRALLQPVGLWGGSQEPDTAYFEGDDAARRGSAAPPADPTIYTGWNAQWISALADAGARFDRKDWIQAAATALGTLLELMAAPGDLLHHYLVPGGTPELPVLLADPLHAGVACVTVAQATGSARWLENARKLAQGIEKAFWAEDGGFWDRARSPHDVGVLRYRDRPFELNSEAARFLLDLASATGERKYRALAERILALLSPQAGRYGVDGAAFALAVEEFFEPPTRIMIAGDPDAGRELRRTALLLGVPGRRVFPVRIGDRQGPFRFATEEPAAAFACGQRGCSPAVIDPAGLPAAVDAVA
jgi:uncharacterized protein YyaL (SSP411 family)